MYSARNILSKNVTHIKKLGTNKIVNVADHKQNNNKIKHIRSNTQEIYPRKYLTYSYCNVRDYSITSNPKKDDDALCRKQNNLVSNKTKDITYCNNVSSNLNKYKLISSKLPSWITYINEIIGLGRQSHSQVDILPNIRNHTLTWYDNSIKDKNSICRREFTDVPKPTLNPSKKHYSRKSAEWKKLCNQTTYNNKSENSTNKEDKKKSLCMICENELIVDHIQDYVSDCSAALKCICNPKSQINVISENNCKPSYTIPKRKSCNALISNEEYKKIKERGLVIPERYFCGAGDIERRVLEAKNKGL